MTNFILHIPTGSLFRQPNDPTIGRDFDNLLTFHNDWHWVVRNICFKTVCSTLNCDDCPCSGTYEVSLKEFAYISKEDA